MERKSFLRSATLVILTILLGISLTACGFINDLLGGGDGDDESYNFDIYVEYYGSKFIGPGCPIIVAVFDHGTPGFNSNAHILTYSSGELNFKQEERVYGVIAFVDENNSKDLDNGEVFQFYNNKSNDPDPIYLDEDLHIDIFFGDAYTWFSGFGFYEDFEDGNDDNWFHDGHWSVSVGEYMMAGDMIYEWKYSYYDADFSNFTYSVDVWQVSGDAARERGIIFRSSNPWDINFTSFDGYLLCIREISGNMKWRLVRYDIGVENILQDWTDSVYLSTGTNKLEVSCSGSMITIYFNDSWIMDIDDPSGHFSGKVGLFGRDDSALYTEFRYDNVDLY